MKITRAGTALTAAFLLSGLWASAALAHPGGGGGHGGGFHGGGSSVGHSFAGRGGGVARGATRQFASRGFVGGGASFAGARAQVGVHTGFAGRTVASAGFRGRAFGPGFRGGFPRGIGFRGGFFGGRFWPGVFYGAGFLWFLPTLPLYCSTYWWEGVPYYYYNDAYYTWSPGADGYVATDPPPAADAAPADSGAGAAAPQAPQGDEPAQYSAPQSAAPQSAGPQINDNVYAYPGNGQSEDQQALDRQQCDQWAGSQAGAAGSPDFRRAVIACFQGRGYSAQ